MAAWPFWGKMKVQQCKKAKMQENKSSIDNNNRMPPTGATNNMVAQGGPQINFYIEPLATLNLLNIYGVAFLRKSKAIPLL